VGQTTTEFQQLNVLMLLVFKASSMKPGPDLGGGICPGSSAPREPPVMTFVSNKIFV